MCLPRGRSHTPRGSWAQPGGTLDTHSGSQRPGGINPGWFPTSGWRAENVNPRGQRGSWRQDAKGVTHGVQGLSVQLDRAHPPPSRKWGFNRQHLAPGGKGLTARPRQQESTPGTDMKPRPGNRGERPGLGNTASPQTASRWETGSQLDLGEELRG
ncbi:unnamed protein product [Rangifer tarandus platyrhynchus]|uniref:Uncharacterized protein n=1 Tax=Rangifer tarandus platyrhynchus TaxID=3082113 RepID=A0ABN8ZE19_RANTA|nr:unnamed protein product [Rangifer tarandus platyrhynchus]